jgi:UDP-glucose 4-epimerase
MADQSRVLVTGGAGFIGSHVVDGLVELGLQVGVLDSLVTGSKANLNPKAKFFLADLTDADAVGRVFAAFKPGMVNHHAAQISVASSVVDPIADAQANVMGSLTLLEACRANDVEHLIFASTGGALYGDPAKQPANEQMPLDPQSPYAASKAAVEAYLGAYKAMSGLKWTALRYANVYGPRQSPDGEAGVVAIFTKKMLAGSAPVIFGSGEQQRDFVYVSDVAAANVAAIEKGLEGAYNVGTGVATSVNDIAQGLASLCGYTHEIEHVAERAGEVFRITLDATLIARDTGWQSETPLEVGLNAVVDYFRAGGGAQ